MRRLKWIGLTIAMIAGTACTDYDTFPPGESTAVKESASLKALIDAGKTVGDGAYRIVDVRPQHKYEKGHIPTAVNIPNGDVEASGEVLPKDKKIIVYCETGMRAQAAAKNELAPAGYTQIYNWGGFGGWKYPPDK